MTGHRTTPIRHLITRCAIIAAVVLACILVVGCGKKPRRTPDTPKPTPPVTTPAPTGSGVQLEMKDGRITFADAGKRIWVAEAKKVSASADANTVEMLDVTCQLYRQGQETLQVHAEKGRATVLSQSAVKVELSGNVKASEAARKLSLTADTFAWTSQDGKISVTNVSWVGRGFSHRADRAVLSTDLTEATFSGRVKTEMSGE